MTDLRDALAAAVKDIAWNAYFRLGTPEDRDTDALDAADDILASSAFRAALTEGIAEAEWFIEDDAWCPGPEKHRDRAERIVARMLGELT